MAAEKSGPTEQDDGVPKIIEKLESESLVSESLESESLEREPEILTFEPEAEAQEEFDPGDIVESAEQLLRESAPHDFQVLVIGGGPGGYAAALRAAELGAQVALIEAEEIGGAYLQEFIPARNALEAVRYRRHSKFPELAALQKGAVAISHNVRHEMHDTLIESGVTLLEGRARFVGEHCVEVSSAMETRRVKAVHVIIAVGARAMRGAFPGAGLSEVLEPRDLLRRPKAPETLVVVGADAVAVELAYLYQTLGSRVTLLEAGPEILPEADSDVRRRMAQVLHKCGVAIETFARVQEAQPASRGVKLHCISGRDEHEVETEADAVLLADDYGVDAQAMELHVIGVDTKDGKILVDEDFQTNINGVYAVGGCVHGLCGPQVARSEGRQVVEYALDYPARPNSLHTPWCCLTEPAAAAVGLTEDVASWAGVLCQVGKRQLYRFGAGTGHKVTEHTDTEHDAGFVKVVIDAESRRLLGCHIVGNGANEMINVVTAAMDAGQTVDEIVATAYTECSLAPELQAAIRAAH